MDGYMEERNIEAAKPTRSGSRKFMSTWRGTLRGKLYPRTCKFMRLYIQRCWDLKPTYLPFSRNHPDFNKQPHGGFSHGLAVPVIHPACDQPCDHRSEKWHKESGTDICIFCIKQTQPVIRCPSCQALTCDGCLRLVKVKEEEQEERENVPPEEAHGWKLEY